MWFLRRPENKSGDEAEAALEDAKAKLQEVQNRGEEVTALSSAIRQIRQRNHFAETLEALILQTRGSHK